MSDINWKDGGDKPLARGDKCAICGESIFAGSRDYCYGKDGDGWVRAHKLCVPRPKDSDDMQEDILIALNRIAEAVERLANQGAK